MRSTCEIAEAIHRTADVDRTGDSDAALLEHFRALQTVRHQLDAQIATTAGVIHRRGAEKHDGSGSTKAWLRNRLQIAPASASSLVDTAAALPGLQLFGPALSAGELSLAHVTVAAWLVKKVGAAQAVRAEELLFPHARKLNPTQLLTTARRIVALLMPEPDDPPDPPEPERSLYISETLDGVS